MRIVIFAFILLLNVNLSAQYKVTKSKLTGWTILTAAGFIDGMVEGFDFDNRTAFERKYNVNPKGYFGSKQHQKKCGWKPFCDFYHDADDFRKFGYISGGVVLTLGEKQKIEYLLIDLGIGLILSAGAKRAGLHYIRN